MHLEKMEVYLYQLIGISVEVQSEVDGWMKDHYQSMCKDKCIKWEVEYPPALTSIWTKEINLLEVHWNDFWLHSLIPHRVLKWT